MAVFTDPMHPEEHEPRHRSTLRELRLKAGGFFLPKMGPQPDAENPCVAALAELACKLSDQSLNDDALEQRANDRVDRGLAWLEQHAPPGYAFNAFYISYDTESCVLNFRYTCKEDSDGTRSVMGRAFASRYAELRHLTVENYATANAVMEFLDLNTYVVHEMGLSAMYDDPRMNEALNRLWEKRLRLKLSDDLRKILQLATAGKIDLE